MPKLLGGIKGERLFLDQDYETMEAMKEFEGLRVEVTVKEMGKNRRDRQNRYYWAAVIPSVVQGFLDRGIKLIGTKKAAKDQAHDAMRMKFLMEEVEYEGGSFRLPKSSTSLTDVEFYDYIFVISEYLREYYDTIVPPPREKI